jgi:hypothetical protein
MTTLDHTHLHLVPADRLRSHRVPPPGVRRRRGRHLDEAVLAAYIRELAQPSPGVRARPAGTAGSGRRASAGHNS